MRNNQLHEHFKINESGHEFWQRLDQLSQTEEFEAWLNREIPPEALQQMKGFNRRNFIKIMAASFAMGGVTACSPQPPEAIVPYVREPKNRIPGKAQFFATALNHKGVVRGVLVESHEGRPTKIEGNPEHPASLGAADIFCQAEILQFYDPDRSQSPLYQGQVTSWDHFQREIAYQLNTIKQDGNKRIRIVTNEISSPFLIDQIKEFLNQFPQAKWYVYEPISFDSIRQGCKTIFGQELQPIYDFSKAERIISFDGDFLFDFPGNIRYARDFAKKRKVNFKQNSNMNRLYSIESGYSLTGDNADHRLAVQPSKILETILYVAVNLGVEGINVNDRLNEEEKKFLDVLIEDLQNFKGKSVILAGPTQPAIVHALVAKINEHMNNQGETIHYVQPSYVKHQIDRHPIQDLQNDMAQEETDLLLMLDSNPAYNAPANINAKELIDQANVSVHMGLYRNETGARSTWHLPMTHELESWSDGYAYDGTVSIIQPLIKPIYGGKTLHQLMAILLAKPVTDADLLLRQYWQKKVNGNFTNWWKEVLKRGLIPDTSFKPIQVSAEGQIKNEDITSSRVPYQFELIFKPDETIWDGEYANNGWLQELPKNISKLTWDNAVYMSPNTASQLDLEESQIITIKHKNNQLDVPVWILEGMADDCLSLSIGYGREMVGRVGDKTGFNAFQLYQQNNDGFLQVEVFKTDEYYLLVSAQKHHEIRDRGVLQKSTLENFKHSPHEIVKESLKTDYHVSLYPGWDYDGQQWGMSIDLTACIGCSACTIACQSENNIPVVGKQEVKNGREMHWIRVDRYVEKKEHKIETYHQPVPCMHCEHAPCELVCPVGATQHSHDGLNDMIYNRCIGTRYCSNNCPYKVRRFNFYRYIEDQIQSLRPMRNPDVTLRSRGVMEKCTYCVQRIRTADIEARKENRLIHEGEIVMACQQTCPTNAIQFGDIRNPDSKVSQEKQEPHSYGMMAELNTRPRTTYLAAIRNPNPKLEEQSS